jgi:hypothetical protein
MTRWYIMPRLEIDSDDVEADKLRLGVLLTDAGFGWVSSKTANAGMVDEAEKPLPPVAKPARSDWLKQGRRRGNTT